MRSICQCPRPAVACTDHASPGAARGHAVAPISISPRLSHAPPVCPSRLALYPLCIISHIYAPIPLYHLLCVSYICSIPIYPIHRCLGVASLRPSLCVSCLSTYHPYLRLVSLCVASLRIRSLRILSIRLLCIISVRTIYMCSPRYVSCIYVLHTVINVCAMSIYICCIILVMHAACYMCC